jgi:hypothetical protein
MSRWMKNNEKNLSLAGEKTKFSRLKNGAVTLHKNSE